MGFFKKLAVRLGGNKTTGSDAAPSLETNLALARRAFNAEQFEESLRLLDVANDMAYQHHDSTLQADIALNRVDCFIQLGNLEQARFVAMAIKERAELTNHRAPLAYALCSLGQIAESESDWDRARELYEEARSIARDAGTLGAGARATAHLAGTYLREGNASFALHLLRDALIGLQRSGDTDLIPEFSIQFAEALQQCGHESEASQAIMSGLQAAVADGNQRAVRSLSLHVARDTVQQGKYELAQRYTQDVIAMPVTQASARKQIAAAHGISSLAARRLGNLEKAIEHADTMITMTDELVDDPLRGEAMAMRGLALAARGEREASLGPITTALAYYDQQPVQALTLELLRARAAAERDPELARQIMERAVKAAEEAELTAEQAQCLIELGRIQRRAGQPQNALQNWTEALQLYETLNQIDGQARCACDMAGLRLVLGQGSRAKREFDLALTLLNRSNDRDTRGVVLSNCGVAFTEFGEIDSAEAFFQESIDIARELNNRRAEALRRGNYARLLALTGRARRAISELNETRQICQETDQPITEAVQIGTLALAHLQLGDISQAILHYRDALTRLENLNDTQTMALLQPELAQALIQLDRLDEAEPLIAAAKQQTEVNADVRVQIGAELAEAELSMKRGEVDAAEAILRRAIQEARSAALRLLEARTILLQSRCDAAQGRADMAQQHWEEASTILQTLRAPSRAPDWLD